MLLDATQVDRDQQIDRRIVLTFDVFLDPDLDQYKVYKISRLFILQQLRLTMLL